MKKAIILCLLTMLIPAAARAAEPGTLVPSRWFFDYDASLPLDVEIAVIDDKPQLTSYRVAFNTTNGLRAPGLYYVPKKFEPPFPAIIVMHGADGSKQDFVMMYEFYAMRGFAVLALDAALHGERAAPTVNAFRADWLQLRDIYMQTVVDLRRGLDWLQSRPEIDPGRMGFWGASMGTIIGTTFCAVDTRIRAAALIIGGADFHILLRHSQLPSLAIMRNYATDAELDLIADQLAVVDPQYYIGAIAPRPVLLMNGEKDYIISKEAGARLQELAGEPKETYWYDGGHLPPFDRVLLLSAQFFKKNLKKTKKQEKPESAQPESGIKPEDISYNVQRDFTDPNRRVIIITASTARALPPGASLAMHFPLLSDRNPPLFDDGTHGDAAAADGTWTMTLILGPHPADIDIVGGSVMYGLQIRALDADGGVMASLDAGFLIGDK